MTDKSGEYAFISDMRQLIPEPQPQSIISRTIYADDQTKVVLFCFDAGQSLSEHTASRPAIIHILQGEATVTLGGNTKDTGAGCWIHMPPNLVHSVLARTPLLMLLTLLDIKS